ncbi:heme-binding domain-containing protein [Niabella hirudinis]|uniref:heme-binding domain-containing protein n=1 Tax=Niabella hirudinis TaxID=1285929 RepID=UPI003EC04275
MKKKIRIGFLVLLFLFIAIQFYRPARNVSKGQAEAPDIAKSFNVPADVKAILQSSCYDCHSNHTNYVWYDYIQPAGMIVENHIRNGKNVLNFNDWGNYSNRKKSRLLNSMKKQIETKEMPLPSYTMFHRKAGLDQNEFQTIISWLNRQIDNND